MQLHSPFVICSCSAFACQPLPCSPYTHPPQFLLTSLRFLRYQVSLTAHWNQFVSFAVNHPPFLLVVLTLAHKRPWALVPTSSPQVTVFGSGFCCLSLAACPPHIALLLCVADLLIVCGTWNNRSWEVCALSLSPPFSLSLHYVDPNHKWNFSGTHNLVFSSLAGIRLVEVTL